MIWRRRQDERTSLCDLVAIARNAPRFKYDYNYSDVTPRWEYDVSKETLSASYRGNNVVICWTWFGDLKKGGGFRDRFLNCVYGTQAGKTDSEIHLNCGADVNGYTTGIGSDDESERKKIREIAEIAKTKYLSQRHGAEIKIRTKYEKVKAVGRKAYEIGKDTVCTLAFAGVLTGIASGAYIALWSVHTGLRAGGEAITKTVFNEARHTHRGTLIDLHKAWLLQTKGYLQEGEFRLDNKTTVKICDTARVLEGKLFDNSRLPYDRKNIGKKYDLEFYGCDTTGYSLLQATPVER